MKILIVDDHAIIRQCLKAIIEAEFKDATCAEAQNGGACVALLKQETFDLLILDLSLPDTDGITLTEWILQRFPEQKILFFTNSATEVYADRLYQMGVKGYLNKQAPVKEIASAIHIILDEKQRYIAEDFKARLTQKSTAGFPENPFAEFSRRELSIAQLLASGRPVEAIASSLNIEQSTIRTYKARIFQKLDVATFPEFIAKAREFKMI